MGGGFSGPKKRFDSDKATCFGNAVREPTREDDYCKHEEKTKTNDSIIISNDATATKVDVNRVLSNRQSIAGPRPSLENPVQLPSTRSFTLTASPASPSSPQRSESVRFLVSKRRESAKLKSTMMSQQRRSDGNVRDLPRGGVYVQTKSCGPIQFGIPPETIKDIMCLGLDLPKYYVIPHRRFDLERGLNTAEFEFPAYFNFFIKRRRINLVCKRDVEPLIRTVFTETLLGPRSIEWPQTFTEDVPKSAYPDLAKEMAFFSKNPSNPNESLSVDTLLSFVHFKDGEAILQSESGSSQVRILETADEFSVFEDDEMVMKTSAEIMIRDIADQEDLDHLEIERLMAQKFFRPPYFGITMLGNSDGFDKSGSTTGFVLWLNQRGIMVDPPPYSGAVLKRVGIHPRLITGMVVTHCHADHDAGAFQKILEEGVITLYTTQIICDSFLRKYSAISGLSRDFLKRLFHFRPVSVGEEVHVYGGFLKFFYSLHAIPCVGFECHHFGKSMIYSADTLNDPPKIVLMQREGYMSKGRARKLIDFPFDKHDVVLHEAGVPPIHTPLTTFEPLSDAVKERLYIVHKNPSTVPPEQKLKPALVGAENTIIISNTKPPNFDAMEILELLGNTDLFKALPFQRGTELVQCAQTEDFKAGEDLIVEGTYGDELYFIALGIVAVLVGPNRKQVKTFSTGDHFGEQSLIAEKQSPRTASISAITDCKVLVLRRNAFHFLIRGTDTVHRLQLLGNMQKSESWQVIGSNSCLDQLTSTQKTYLQSIMEPRRLVKDEVVWKHKSPAIEAVLVVKGSLIFAEAPEMTPFTRGAFVGEFKAIVQGSFCHTTLKATEPTEIYHIGGAKLRTFLEDSPGLLLRLMPLVFVE